MISDDPGEGAHSPVSGPWSSLGEDAEGLRGPTGCLPGDVMEGSLADS